MESHLQEFLVEQFGSGAAPALAFAPGRVNLIGEHVDYNGGVVLPLPLARGTYAAVRARGDRSLAVASRSVAGGGRFDLDARGGPGELGYAAYPLAAVRALAERGVAVPGLDLALAGDLAVGAGLSSSASLLVAVLRAVDRLLGLGLAPEEHAALAHRAETQFVGLQCGIMDLYAAAVARPGHALLLDCRDRSYEHVPLPQHFELAVVDSGTRRALGDSPFNARVQDCVRAVEELRAAGVPCSTLRDLDAGVLESASGALDGLALVRARHVVGEIERVFQFRAALEVADLAECGRLLLESHASLRDRYECSTPELDFLVEAAAAVPGVAGARLTGAGFGGSILALGQPGTTARIEAEVLPAYRRKFGAEPRLYAIYGPANAT